MPVYIHKLYFHLVICFVAAPAFAETVKATEPITTVLIGRLFFNEGTSAQTYSTLIPICFGVAISCYHNENFHLLAFMLAFGSNFGFSSRAVFAKKLSLFFPDEIDEVVLFSVISLLGLIVLIPFSLFTEGLKVYDFLLSGNVDFKGSSALLIVNGFCFATYNLLSYVVLKRTDLVTHSVLNCFRRVFIIIFTSLWFQDPISTSNGVGVIIAVLGVLLFGYSHSNDKAKTHGQLLL